MKVPRMGPGGPGPFQQLLVSHDSYGNGRTGDRGPRRPGRMSRTGREGRPRLIIRVSGQRGCVCLLFYALTSASGGNRSSGGSRRGGRGPERRDLLLRILDEADRKGRRVALPLVPRMVTLEPERAYLPADHGRTDGLQLRATSRTRKTTELGCGLRALAKNRTHQCGFETP